MKKTINIIDLFAGPGGLGEGFSSHRSDDAEFRIRMSVEKEESAHKTLTSRAFFRLLKGAGKQDAYFDYAEGRISRNEMISKHPDVWNEALQETMFRPTALGEDNDKIRSRLSELKKQYSNEPWIVIGGPPCQAYSLVGRARNKGIVGYSAENDHRHFLYQEYLNVLTIMEPDVFVMENVKGILSSKVGGEHIFPKILEDLENPNLAVVTGNEGRKYRIYSLTKRPDKEDLLEPCYSDSRDFIIRSEQFGVPQARHRVILLGVAMDIQTKPSVLNKKPVVPVESILAGLPVLRSKLSKEQDQPMRWREVIADYVTELKKVLVKEKRFEPLIKEMNDAVQNLRHQAPTVGSSYPLANPNDALPSDLKDWLLNSRPGKVLNHSARGHMNSDLIRYLFSACWANPNVFGDSDKPFPKSEDYPDLLAPAHANWKSGKFADRFRVQRYGRPATTVTSHISKDGHYFIHPDATQCRSLTVREAARIQTFPDNYFFEGNRTQQYVQVGNAVPPFLAIQLAAIVSDII
ncbi:DNA cytosine methyltransferase [Lacimicrobium alkaliphilum]|nr:DNA (cytosine-5-)-methyltransferase [Lacimicrobium alkaliphilum]